MACTFATPTAIGHTDDSGAFDYFPGERVDLAVGSVALGSPLAGHKISPLSIFESADLDDDRVLNVARLLQSLDADGQPQGGISITDTDRRLVEQTMIVWVSAMSTGPHDLVVDRSDPGHDRILLRHALVEVSKEDAREHLDKDAAERHVPQERLQDPGPRQLQVQAQRHAVVVPGAEGQRRSGRIPDEDGADHPAFPTTTRTATSSGFANEAKPLVVTYTDADPVTGAHDVWAAVSRDDGNTWKRKNLSRPPTAPLSTLARRLLRVLRRYKKPVFQVKGNKILVAWTSKFCRGGKPAYAIAVDDPATTEDEGDGYIYDDPYWTDDIWGVAGPQRSHDYTEDGFPEVGEVPYSCVWVAPGVVATAADVGKGLGEFVGDIVWFKPERLTSGRRDANQIFMGGADGAGIRHRLAGRPRGPAPRRGRRPRPRLGWRHDQPQDRHLVQLHHLGRFRQGRRQLRVRRRSGARRLDVVARPKALVPMSLPVRLSDNDVVNTDNLMVELDGNGYPVDADGNFNPIPNPDTDGEGDGTHRYGYELAGLCETRSNLRSWTETRALSTPQRVGTTSPTTRTTRRESASPPTARLLDGDTGASRPNLFLQTYTKSDGTQERLGDHGLRGDQGRRSGGAGARR